MPSQSSNRRRFYGSRYVQQLIFRSLEGGECLNLGELSERITAGNGGARIRLHVRDLAITHLHARDFLELRALENGLCRVVEVRIRNDAHRQWRCGAREWICPPRVNRPHEM